MTHTDILHCAALLTESGWQDSAYIGLDAQGVIQEITNAKPNAGPTPREIGGFVIPGMQNAHSHAFQYAMAGLAEHLPPGSESDDFWSWREAMYSLAGRVTPTQVEAIATMLYAEMQRRGFTSVAEFHYLHHDKDGRPYKNPAEMSERIMVAAQRTGIQLTIIPIFYQMGGFKQQPFAGQARFLSKTRDDYLKLLDAVIARAKVYQDVNVGIGVHSLRAVAADDIKAVFGGSLQGPAHIHVAEQPREVEECLEHLGKRPVAWLLDNVPVDEHFHLVHATHMSKVETAALAKSGATAVICPSTEGNLGDGFFPFHDYLMANGKYAIGTDSHVGLNPFEELRWLDYGQRLRAGKRNILCQTGGEDSGQKIFKAAWQGGRAAMGRSNAKFFAIGEPLHALVLDPDHPVLSCRPPERRLSSLVYAGDQECIMGTLRRGKYFPTSKDVGDDFKAPFLKTLASLR